MESPDNRKVGDRIGFQYISEMIEIAQSEGYRFVDYEEVGAHPKAIVLRHDVDVEPLLALKMGAVQAKFGVSATYYVMLRNPLYNLLAKKYVKALQGLAQMGHRIGLHFDASCYEQEVGARIVCSIESEMQLLARVIAPVIPSKFVSFHQPTDYILENDLSCESFISAYSPRFFKDIRYISDSCGQWREQSIIDVLRSGAFPKIQFTSHPIWWTTGGDTVKARLKDMLQFKWRELQRDLGETINDPSRGAILFNQNADE